MKIEISRTNRQIGEDQLIAATVETVRLPETVPPGLQSAQRSPASVHRHHQGRPGQQHDIDDQIDTFEDETTETGESTDTAEEPCWRIWKNLSMNQYVYESLSLNQYVYVYVSICLCLWINLWNECMSMNSTVSMYVYIYMRLLVLIYMSTNSHE